MYQRPERNWRVRIESRSPDLETVVYLTDEKKAKQLVKLLYGLGVIETRTSAKAEWQCLPEYDDF